MSSESEFILDELPDVASIIQNECWLEGQRRGCAVDPSDDFIRRRVAEIILSGAGEYMRRIRDSAGRRS
jgi:hypothetical protein